MALSSRRLNLRSVCQYRHRVEIFILALCAGGAAAWWWAGGGDPHSSEVGFRVAWWWAAASFFAAEGWAVHVHFRSETHSISLSEVALVPGLLFLPPHQLIAAQLLGAGTALVLRRRQRLTKLLFNLAAFVVSTSLGVMVFRSIVRTTDLYDPRLWVGVAAASLVGSLVGIALVSAIIFVAEGEWSMTTTLRTVTISLGATLATTSFALAFLAVVTRSVTGLVLFVPPAISLILLFRAYVRQIRSHEHLAFLYDSMAATQNAPDFGLAVTQLLGAARNLVRADYAEIVLLFPESETGLQSVSSPHADALMQAVPTSHELRRALYLAQDAGGVLIPRGGDSGELAPFMHERGLADAIVAPLVDDERVFGLMVFGNRSGDVATFTRDEHILAMTFAGHASVLLENGRLEKTLANITELQNKLHHLAFHDPLTELPNRAAFLELVEDALSDSRPVMSAVLFVDLDNFKSINDTHGHAAGNELLIQVGARLRSVANDQVSAARLGGDEFAVLVRSGSDGGGERIAAQIEALFEETVEVEANRFAVSPSIGVAVATPGMTSEELLRNADVAMYAAKAAGKGCVRVFQTRMYEQIRSRHELDQDIRRALADNQFFAVFQPIVDLADGQIVGFEALARWAHPTRGVLAPAEFLPLAEETGLITAIDSRVMRQACAALSRWRAEFPEHRRLRLNVNTSPEQLHDEETIRRIERTLAANGLETSMITLEITETAMMRDTDAAIERARELVGRGLELAIDDFGTGHSSLARLEQFPLHSIKIAKPFVDRLVDPTADTGIIGAILEIARAVGAATVAEGIETETQADALRLMGCQMGQGFFFARPLAEDQAANLLASQLRLPRAA